ncbi:MAG: hypothetical protein ACRELT_03280 [Longimicrobiales bacterium]
MSKPSVGNRLATRTSRSGDSYGSGRSTTPFSTLKIALFAPIPSARVRMAMNANPGARASERKAYRTSENSSAMRSSMTGGCRRHPQDEWKDLICH